MRTQASTWDNSLQTGKDPLVLDLSKLVFGLSYLADRLAKLVNDKDKEDVNINTNRATCFTLLTLSLLQNVLKSLEDIEATPL